MKNDSYIVHTDLKKLIKAAGLTVRDVAIVLGITPPCLNNQMNGYTPMSPETEEWIQARCTKQIKKMKEEKNENRKLSTADAAIRQGTKAKAKPQGIGEVEEENA
jgi:DNA transposition AAA+ family ATPase